jgi:diguanylate cyclase (GGDEF)-like protein/PAS domain S-box-containing protein
MHPTTDSIQNKSSYADVRLDALLSITGRMDGFLYRCRNDQSFTMLYISDGISNISGYPPGDFIQNKVLEYVSVIHPDDLERVFAAVNTALEAKRNWNVDYRIVPNFGRAVWVREIGGGVLNDRGELVFLEGFVIDISDRKMVEDSNAYLMTQLKDLNELLSAQKRELQLAKQKSDHSANHDALTGLPNRRAFHNQLKLAMDRSHAANTSVGLLFIDLDRFKEVNDTLGHESGDALLQHVSSQLQTLLRSTDYVARLGGDEFAFLLFGDPELTREVAVAAAQRVVEKLRIDVPSPAGVIRVGCTVGVAMYPADASDPKGLLALADRLMYVGKKGGRNRLMTVNELEAA